MSSDPVADFKADRIDQRGAVRALMKTGRTASDAYRALGILPAESDPPSTPDIAAAMDQVLEYATRIQQLAAHPIVVAELHRMAALDPESKLDAASEFVSKFSDAEFLKRLGIDPTDRRLSLRVFEKPFNSSTKEETLGESPGQNGVAANWTICGSVGYLACISIGRTP